MCQRLLAPSDKFLRGYWQPLKTDLSAIPLKKLTGKIKIQEATDSFKTYSMKLGFVDVVAYLSFVRQSL
jgi:hypothetical protein